MQGTTEHESRHQHGTMSRRAADRLVDAAAALAAVCTDAPTDEALLRAVDLLGEAQRLLDVVALDVASRVDRPATDDGASLARRHGARSAAELLVQRAGIEPRRAADLVAVATAIAPCASLLGEPLPSPHRPVAEALDAGELSLEAARLIVSTLDAVSTDATTAVRVEHELVTAAPALGPRYLVRLCRAVESEYSPVDPAARERRLRDKAGLRRTQGRDGLVRYVIDADPESAGFLDAAIDARTAPTRPAFRSVDDADGPDDARPTWRRRLDALVSIARDAIARDDGAVAGTAVTMVVTVPLEGLLTGLGEARIEGIDEPISAGTARRLAADADLIPAVLGTASEPLDLGRSARLFSPAQRRAIALRDDGCAWPGCTAPPGWCQIAHILAWMLFGPTDLQNGIMLCPFHHRLFDLEGWALEWRAATPWFIPPPHVDASRTARRGGRRRTVAA